ncbi:hypothetical protein E2P81_ATG06504 [Venturia nashicola]|uniref:DUF262 domain-containing protein n=1 Tax=Venturia nashicola TaxID=86259 RepID=A0A4Z1P4Q1_9PEZI|nr:hypothetical protein E6O75_ATG06671 [Venturia nashicola]TLD29851.1 hypothetical protein E2P81_ATG06504 [Venturia nashicola]
MSAGRSHVSASDEKRPMEIRDPDGTHIIQDDPRTAPPQEEYTDHILDESEPEVASDSDGDDDVFFKPSPSLPPNVIKRTLRELNDLMNTPYLDLNLPEYRHRRYEGNEDLTSIIDSFSQNYEFPPISFNQKQVRGPDGSIQYSRVCIDGLKRLSAIKAFMDGEIPCHDHRRRKWFYCIKSKNDLGARAVGGRRILPMDDKEDFQNKHFVCHEFEDLTGTEEIELRARVHLGSILTPGEKLRAAMIFSGELMINFAKTLERDFQQIAELADTRRMKGFHNLMKCSSQIFEIQRARAENRVPVLRISETAINDFIKYADASALERIKKTLGVFDILVTRHPEVFYPMPGVPFRPMEMIIIAVLAFKCYQTNVRPLRFIRFIASLRDSTHKFSSQQGVFQTRRIWNYAWNFIENIEDYVIEGEVSDSEQAVSTVTQSEKAASAVPEEVAALALHGHVGSRASSATFSPAHSFPGMQFMGSPSSLSQQSTAVKRKASPHPLDLVKKQVQVPTPVSPAILQSPRVSLRADSPDSVLGSGDLGDENVAETTGGTIQEDLPAHNIAPVPAPRQLVRSSFKSRSEFVPHRSESPKGNTSTLNTLIASVPAPPSPSKAVSSSPSALNVLFGASQRPLIKSSLLYSHETKKTVPYQSSQSNVALPSEEPPLRSGDRHVTPINQGHLVGYETPTIPPYSGRGRPRKYPPKSATPEGQTPRKRGRPRKDSNSVVPGTPSIQAHGTRGRGRGMKSIPGGFSTRATPTSPPAVEELHTASPRLRQNGGWAVNMEPSAILHQNVSPALIPPHSFAMSSDRPRKDVIPSSTPSAASPPPNSQSEPSINQYDVEPLPPDVRSNQEDQAQRFGPVGANSPSPKLDGDACYDQPLEGQSSAASTDPKQALAPAKVPAPPAPRAQSIMQPRAVSISSSREPSVSRLSTVRSLSTMSPRTTPDPSLVDAKPFVASFKAGGANAIRERRRQQQAELEEKKRRKQEAENLANSAAVSVTPKD